MARRDEGRTVRARTGTGAQGMLLPSLAAFLWAGNFVVGRAAVATIPPIELNFLRWSVAALACAPIVWRDRRRIGATLRSHPGEIVLLSMLSVVLFNTLLYGALQKTTAAMAGGVFAAVPVLILPIAALWGNRALSLRQCAGCAVSLAGVLVLIAGRQEDGEAMAAGLSGPVLLLLAAAVFAFYTVAVARLRLPLSPLPALATTIWCGVIVMVPFAAVPLSRTAGELTSTPVLLSAAYLGLGASFAAFLLWQVGVGIVGAKRAGLFLNLVPVGAVLLSASLLDEALGVGGLVGLGVILCGVATAQGATGGSG